MKRGFMLPKPGSYVHIQSFKHDGSLHRTWCQGYVLEADENKIVAVTDRAWVIEDDGRKWITREPAICFFYTHKWFNVISMIRHEGLVLTSYKDPFDTMTTNVIGTTSVLEAIRNIDYDLDVKLYPDGGYSILDENEYADHAKKMKYPKKIMDIVEKQMELLIDMMDREEEPFNQSCIDKYYDMYLNMTSGAK